MSPPQLPLPLRFPSHQRIEDFQTGSNTAAVAAVRHAAEGGGSLFLAGPASSGKTHLLIAACQHSSGDVAAQYLPLGHVQEHAAAALAAIRTPGLIAIDEIDALSGDHTAQIALFDLFNRVAQESGTLLFAARSLPLRLPLELPDLVSRLSSLPAFELTPLNEADRRTVLVQYARDRGLDLDDAVLDFLFRRHARDLSALLRLLDRADRESMAAQRRVTVPFLRTLIEIPGVAASGGPVGVPTSDATSPQE